MARLNNLTTELYRFKLFFKNIYNELDDLFISLFMERIIA